MSFTASRSLTLTRSPAKAEDANMRRLLYVARVCAQDIATRQMEPSDYDDSVADLQIPHRVIHIWLKHQPSLRGALVTLASGFCGVDQGGLDASAASARSEDGPAKP